MAYIDNRHLTEHIINFGEYGVIKTRPKSISMSQFTRHSRYFVKETPVVIADQNHNLNEYLN